MKNCFAFLWLLLFAWGCNDSQPSNAHIFPVKVATVVQRDVPVYIEAIGNVSSLKKVQVRPQVGGVIVRSYIKEGQYVKKGDPLFQVDPRPYEAALKRTKAALIKDTATLKYSEEQVERNKELAAKDYISKLSYEQFVSQVEFNKGQILSDQADIALAELNLEWATLSSPIDGKVSFNKIDPGNLVVANDGNAITTILSISPADISFKISQTEFFKFQRAFKAGELHFEVILPQDKQTPRQGEIYFVDNQLDQNTGTILLKGTVPNDDEIFWPGEFVRVRLRIDVEHNAALLPEEAVKIGQEGAYVYVYKPETATAEYRKVVKGEKVDKMIVVKEGVQLGEKVITTGQGNLLPGARVNIVATEQGRP